MQALAEATCDASEYIVDIAKTHGLAGDLQPLDGPITLHIACHARAQNMGAKAAEMLRLIPDTEVKVIERCSGHGGTWGIKKQNFEIGMKIGKPVIRDANKNDPEGTAGSLRNVRLPRSTCSKASKSGTGARHRRRANAIRSS